MSTTSRKLQLALLGNVIDAVGAELPDITPERMQRIRQAIVDQFQHHLLGEILTEQVLTPERHPQVWKLFEERGETEVLEAYNNSAMQYRTADGDARSQGLDALLRAYKRLLQILYSGKKLGNIMQTNRIAAQLKENVKGLVDDEEQIDAITEEVQSGKSTRTIATRGGGDSRGRRTERSKLTDNWNETDARRLRLLLDLPDRGRRRETSPPPSRQGRSRRGQEESKTAANESTQELGKRIYTLLMRWEVLENGPRSTNENEERKQGMAIHDIKSQVEDAIQMHGQQKLKSALLEVVQAGNPPDAEEEERETRAITTGGGSARRRNSGRRGSTRRNSGRRGSSRY